MLSSCRTEYMSPHLISVRITTPSGEEVTGEEKGEQKQLEADTSRTVKKVPFCSVLFCWLLGWSSHALPRCVVGCRRGMVCCRSCTYWTQPLCA